MTPKMAPKLLLWGLFFKRFQHIVFGPLLAHYCPPRLHFEVVWASFWAPKAQIWGHMAPMFATFVAVRFKKNNLHIAPTSTPITYKNISPHASHKAPLSQGAAVSRSVLRNISAAPWPCARRVRRARFFPDLGLRN